MTYSDDFTLPKAYLEQLAEGGMDYMPECKSSNQFGHKLVETSANFQNYTPAICR